LTKIAADDRQLSVMRLLAKFLGWIRCSTGF
jgi:hypothetical protein